MRFFLQLIFKNPYLSFIFQSGQFLIVFHFWIVENTPEIILPFK